MTWDTGMNEFRNDYLRENPEASAQEVRMAGSQPQKGLISISLEQDGITYRFASGSIT